MKQKIQNDFNINYLKAIEQECSLVNNAVHEACHAIVAEAVGGVVYKIDIGINYGKTDVEWWGTKYLKSDNLYRFNNEQKIGIALTVAVGIAFERKISGERWPSLAENDTFVTNIVISEISKWNKDIEHFINEAWSIVEERWELVIKIANLCIKERTLFKHEIAEILAKKMVLNEVEMSKYFSKIRR